MRRLFLALLTAAAVAVPVLGLAAPAAADPLEPVRVVQVFVTGDGQVCATYRDGSTICTNS